MKIIPDDEAIRFILMSTKRGPNDPLQVERVPRYACYLGAGVSVEAGVKSADAISNQIHDLLVERIDRTAADYQARVAQLEKSLDWDDLSRRYTSCVQVGYPDEPMRVAYFRSILAGVTPTFSHYAIALLMQARYLMSTALTTNFDKLLETAFVRLEEGECQPLRTDDELRYWVRDARRYYVLKLHGDYDTHNVANTAAETVGISSRFEAAVANTLESSGLLVLGAAGREKSVHTLLDRLTNAENRRRNVLQFGILWGVYMGQPKPRGLTPEQLKDMVEKRVADVVGRDIVRMIEDVPAARFFPVWGASTFLYDLIAQTGERGLIATAERYLDQEMRIRQVFRREGLSDAAIQRHLDNLKRARPAPQHTMPEVASKSKSTHGDVEVRIVYGDITVRRFMADAELKDRRRAVVSPDDTLITVGGGVAERLMEKAGRQFVLNEVAKFAPIPHGEVAVTSAGHLPVHYVFHAAALKISEAAHDVSKDSVRNATSAALRNAVALGVGALSIPLMGTGAGGLTPIESLEGILEAIAGWEATASVSMIIMVFIYKREMLEKHIVDESMRKVLGIRFGL